MVFISPILSNDSYGALYMLPIDSYKPIFAKDAHFLQGQNHVSTIGLQIFPRSGWQKGFLYNCIGKEFRELHNESFATVHYFRHDKAALSEIFNMMNEGKDLFPADYLVPVARCIRNSRKVFIEAVRYNISHNSGETEESIIRKLRDLYGIEVNYSQHPQFMSLTQFASMALAKLFNKKLSVS